MVSLAESGVRALETGKYRVISEFLLVARKGKDSSFAVLKDSVVFNHLMHLFLEIFLYSCKLLVFVADPNELSSVSCAGAAECMPSCNLPQLLRKTH